MARRNAAERHAAELFDLLAAADQHSDMIMAVTGWNRTVFSAAVQKLRDICAASGDVITVIATPDGRGPWTYGLRAGNTVMDPEQPEAFWVINRLQDAERRIETIKHVLEVAARSLDGRTVAGRKARIYRLHIARAQEEVAMLNDGTATP